VEFLKAFMLKGALITPRLLYIGSVLFGVSCVWEPGLKERKQIALAMMFLATVLLGILMWSDSYRGMAELMRATYYFPE
jgi:hypothetical protein